MFVAGCMENNKGRFQLADLMYWYLMYWWRVLNKTDDFFDVFLRDIKICFVDNP